METRGALAGLVAARMEALSLQAVDVSALTGLSKSYVSALLKGKVALPGADKRRDLARVLGVRHVDLLIAAGELARDEVEASAGPPVVDFRLGDIVRGWPLARSDVQEIVHSVFLKLTAVPELRVDAEEAPVIAVAR
jgi:transcriptional regulator with XRE-family HTH domain